MPAALHDERLDTVVRYLIASGATSVLDLGCGPGQLLLRLAVQPQFDRILGLDIDQRALAEARLALGLSAPYSRGRVQIRYGSFQETDPALTGFDAAALVETIEHVDPRHLSRVEDAVFGGMRPRTVLITTPNQEYNRLHGMAPGERRHPGHRFEWSREKFRRWARGIATRRGYQVALVDVGPFDDQHGSSTQMAHFTDPVTDPASSLHQQRAAEA